MPARELLTVLGLAAGLIFLLVLSNFYYLRPALKPRIPNIPPLPEIGRLAPPVDKNELSKSLAKIRKTKKRPARPEEPLRVVERNPFLWPDEEIVRKAPSEEARPWVFEEGDTWQVGLIIVGQKGRLATINGRFVRPGDKFEQMEVSRIDRDSLLLTNEAGEVQLRLGDNISRGLPESTGSGRAESPPLAERPPRPVRNSKEAYQILMKRLGSIWEEALNK